MAPTQPFSRFVRTERPRTRLLRRAISCVLFMGLVLVCAGTALAQGGVPLVTIATDESGLQIPNQFSIPTFTAINQEGDFAFIGNGSSGLFFRHSGTSSATLLLQMGDQVPGVPESIITSFSPVLGLNNGQSILFGASYTLPDGLAHAAVLTYAALNYSIVATSDDVAPGSGGATYGTSLVPGSINDNGDINFTAVPLGKTATTYYIVPAGGTAVCVAALDDASPVSCSWCVVTSGSVSAAVDLTSNSYIPPLNTSGQIAISFGGGLFIGSKNGLQLVPQPTSGPCSPVSSSIPGSSSIFPLTGNSVPLNNASTVAFTSGTYPSNAICVSTGGATAAAVVISGGAAPAAIGGTFLNLILDGLDDSGDVLFEAEIVGGSTLDALLRYHPAGASAAQTDVVAYIGQALPVPSGFLYPSPSITLGPPSSSIPFPSFHSVSISNTGLVSFSVPLSPSGSAVFQQAAAALPTLLALSGEAAPSSGGGSLQPSSVAYTVTLNDGATFFPSAIANGTASFGEFLGTSAGLQALMTTADPLPLNARLSFIGAAPSAAGDDIAFLGQLPGAGRALFLSHVFAGGVIRVATDNDFGSPTLSSPFFGPLTLGPNFFVNAVGQVAFQVAPSNEHLQIGTGLQNLGVGLVIVPSLFPTQSCGTIYLGSLTGLTKVVAPGDPGPVAGTTFSCAWLNSGVLSPLNGSGQLVFDATTYESPNPPSPPAQFSNGVYVYSPGSEISRLVAVSETIPNSTAPVSAFFDIPNPINSSGQVAFGIAEGTGISSPGFFEGLLLDAAGGTPSTVARLGESIPGSTGTLGQPYFISGLNDNGGLAFTSTATDAADGLFRALSGQSVQTLALDGGVAPGGGTFSLATSVFGAVLAHGNFALMNNGSDVAFRAGISGGTGDSGYFRALNSGPNAGVLQPVVLQGQFVPPAANFGNTPGSGTLNTVPFPGNQGAAFALGPDGSLAFLNGFNTGAAPLQGMFVARLDGTIQKVLATGDTPPGGGIVKALSMSQGVAAGGTGQFAFWAGIQNGDGPEEAIFVTSIAPGMAATSILGGYQRISPVFGTQITFQATVTSTATGTSTGSVSFFDGGVLFGTAALNAGQATVNISTLATGPHSIVAQYSGDTNFAPSTWSSPNLLITPRTTSTAVTSSLNPAVGGQAVTFTVTVTTSPGTAPTGAVTFLDGGTSIGTATLNGDAVATLSTTALSVASHSITASYAGDLNSTSSTSPPMTETIAVAGFAPVTSALNVTPGQSVNIPLTLYAAPGANLTFTLVCSNLPFGAGCTFGTNPVTPAAPPNGTAVQLTLTTMASSNLGPVQPHRGDPVLPGFELVGFLAALLGAATLAGRTQRPRRRLASCASLTAFALALALGGCGSGAAGNSSNAPPTQGTPPGPASFTVTGTSGSTTVSVVINVNVQ